MAKRAQAAEANPHVTDIKLLGWKPALAGTCADASGNQMNGMKKGGTTTLMSQRACAAACDAAAGCIGYQHGEVIACEMSPNPNPNPNPTPSPNPYPGPKPAIACEMNSITLTLALIPLP